MTIDLNSTYRTIAGDTVELHTTTDTSHFPVVGTVTDHKGINSTYRWTLAGKFDIGAPTPLDLVLITTTISTDKTYRTVEGRDVKIYSVDAGTITPVHGAIRQERGWTPCAWTNTGQLSPNQTTKADLVEVKPLQDKDIVWGTQEVSTHAAVIGFYDATNNCMFAGTGERNGITWDNYELCSNPPQFILDARVTLQD